MLTQASVVSSGISYVSDTVILDVEELQPGVAGGGKGSISKSSESKEERRSAFATISETVMDSSNVWFCLYSASVRAFASSF